MRRLTTALLSVALVPAAVTLPTMSAPAASPHAVAPKLAQVALPVLPLAARAAAAVAAAPRAGVPVAAISAERTRRFDLAAVTWTTGTAPKGMVVRVRVHEKGGWTPWQVLAAMDETPQAGSRESARADAVAREGTDPFMTEAADGVGIRVESPDGSAPKGLRADLIDGGRSAADAAATPAGSASAAAATPTVITRAQWGCDESLRTGSPTYNTRVKALVLHHTAGSNSYSSAGAFAELRADYAYHTRVRGWSDIGYNIVIDRYGRVYEGRKGSITAAVMGAHAGGFNVNTFGYSVMGNYDTARPPAAVITAVEKAMAWKAEEFGINARATTSLTSSGGGTSKYAAGVTVTKPTIMGHRDVGYTACPGRYLYPYMATIRAYIAKVVTAPVTALATTPAARDYAGGPIALTARLSMRHTWSMTVSGLCGGTVRSLSGSAARGTLSAAWDLKNAGGAFVPPGIYTLTATLTSQWGVRMTVRSDVEVLTTPSSPSPICPTARLSGPDRYTTSVVVGRAAWPAATQAVLAAGASVADGVVAAPLAAHLQAPLLLTLPTGLPASVSQDLQARHVSDVWIVGGTAAVPEAVVTALRAIGVTTINRLSGATRFGTAAAVAAQVGTPTGAAIFASGLDANLIDAVSAGGPAGTLRRPILLVTPTEVPAETRQAIASLHITSAHVLGSAGAVPETIAGTLGTLGVTQRTRLAGTDRYSTAAAIATAFGASLGTARVAVAPGDAATLVDALVSGQLGRPAVLTGKAGVPLPTRTWLASANPASVALVGGPPVVSTTTLRALAAAAAS